MKMKKFVGALALTAALAMGTTPAFATGTAVGNDQLFSQLGNAADNKATGNTDVYGLPINAQLIVSVPIDITVVVPTTGGDLICPTSDAYRIQNRSANSVYVINAELKKGSFEAVENATDQANAYANKGRAMQLSGNNVNFATSPSPLAAANWEITAGSSANPTNYGITLEGTTNDFSANPLTAGQKTSAMVTIVYTVSNVTTNAGAGA